MVFAARDGASRLGFEHARGPTIAYGAAPKIDKLPSCVHGVPGAWPCGLLRSAVVAVKMLRRQVVEGTRGMPTNDGDFDIHFRQFGIPGNRKEPLGLAPRRI